MRERSHPLTCNTQCKCSDYTGSPGDSPNSGACLWGHLEVFFDVCSLQVGSTNPRDKTPPPIAGPSTPSDRLSPFDTAAPSPVPSLSPRAPIPASSSESAPPLALAPALVSALDSHPAAVLQDDPQDAPVAQNATLSLLVAARPSTGPSSRSSEANNATVTSESSANPSTSTSGSSGDQNDPQDTQDAAPTSSASKTTSGKVSAKKGTNASAKQTIEGPAKKITAR